MKIVFASLQEKYRQSFSWKWVGSFWPVYLFCFFCILLAYGFLGWLYLCLQQPDLGENITYLPITEDPLLQPFSYFIFALEIFSDVFHFLVIQSAVYIGYYWYKKNYNYALQAFSYTLMIAFIDFLYWGGAAFVCTQITKLVICPDSSFFTLECYGGEPIWDIWLKALKS